MKRVFLFIGVFAATYLIVQIAFGSFMTLFYTPNVSDAWKEAGSLSSTITLMSFPSILPMIATLMISGAIAYLATKLADKKV